ncbi:hypothetical protein [Winogradskyella sp.]|uniref:hypothetical protein n=1 Tax=Winogradskyella sp. TaxID=1883156 RepID=UPI00262739E4|nr:hypothetical protein [Winogradskyella sp.]
MKKILIILVCILCNTVTSQEIGYTYQFISPIYDSEKTVQFKKGHKVYVTMVGKDSISFSYYKFTAGVNTEELNDKYYFIDKKMIEPSVEDGDGIFNNGNLDPSDIRTFTLSVGDFDKYLTRFYPRFKGVSAGIFTVPFKLRIDDFDFEQNVNIGMNLSFPFRMNRLKNNEHLLTPTLGIGLATISLNPNNSDLEASDDENENRTASAFSISGGIMYQFSSTINIGFQYGFDFLGNKDKDIRWKYDRKPWIGIGINIGVSVSDNEVSNPKNKS